MVGAASGRAVEPALVPTATLAVAAACWGGAVWLMNGMDMGVATRPGSFGFFAAAWMTMMAAMMLPGAAPAAARKARVSGTMRSAATFAVSYLAVWAVVGLAAYALDRPHGTLVAGAVVIGAGAFELTPVKRTFRRRCREETGSGVRFGLCCAGSSLGLMAILVAVDVMSLFWMAAVTVIVCAQKLLPAKAAVDIPVALALIGLGLVIVFAPSAVPGLMPPTM